MTNWIWTGDTLRAALRRRGISQAELARRMMVSRQRVHQILNAREPQASTIRAICIAVNCSADELLDITRQSNS